MLTIDKISPFFIASETSPYEITECMELGMMAKLFFHPFALGVFHLFMIFYLWGDLAIFGATVAKSLRDLICDMPNNISDISELCWQKQNRSYKGMHYPSAFRTTVYYTIVVMFFIGQGAFLITQDVSKTKKLQKFTMFLRWVAFGCMIIMAIVILIFSVCKGENFAPRPYVLEMTPNMIGICVYSFMCHHSLPVLMKQISNKTNIHMIVFKVYLGILAFYVVLGLTGTFAFQEINELYTLNFQQFIPTIFNVLLSLFPVYTLSLTFPIIVTTFRNNVESYLVTGDIFQSCRTKLKPAVRKGRK